MGSSKVAATALDFIDEVADLLDEAEIRDRLLLHGQKLGYSNMIVLDLPEPGQPLQVHLCNWPSEFYRRYFSHYYADDPLARHARGTTEPFVWSEVLWDGSRGSREQRVIDAAGEYGLEDGFVLPIMGIDGDMSGISLAGSRTHLSLEERRALHLMCVYAHHAIRSRRSARFNERVRSVNLTQQERTCAAYAFNGLGMDEMAARMRLPAADVRKVSGSMMGALQVRTLAEAASKAVLLKQINP